MAYNDIFLLIIAVAFAVFVIFFVVVLIKLVKLLISLQKQIDSLGSETKELVHSVNQISEDILYKMQSTNPLFQALSNLGEGLEYKSLSYKEKISWLNRKKEPGFATGNKEIFCNVLDLALAGVKIWRSLKDQK